MGSARHGGQCAAQVSRRHGEEGSAGGASRVTGDETTMMHGWMNEWMGSEMGLAEARAGQVGPLPVAPVTRSASTRIRRVSAGRRRPAHRPILFLLPCALPGSPKKFRLADRNGQPFLMLSHTRNGLNSLVVSAYC